MILSEEEFLNALNEVVGDDNSDNSLNFIENMTDTYNNLKTNSSENWQQRYEENDKNWREKYKQRFLSGEEVKDNEENNNEEKEITTFSELFTMKGR